MLCSAESFSKSSPADTSWVQAHLEQFLCKHRDSHRPIAVITSGGTTVPLEKNCVRFIDNFSKGTRGALSAEEFLKARAWGVCLRGLGHMKNK